MKAIYTLVAMVIILSSCSKGFMKKEEGNFTANGTRYVADEDMMTANYNSANELDVTIFGGSGGSYKASVRLNLTKIDTTIKISENEEGFIYYGENSAVQYLPIQGEYKITSYKEGNPATRHTEGTFSYIVVKQYSPYDTIRVTDGYFYVNNY